MESGNSVTPIAGIESKEIDFGQCHKSIKTIESYLQMETWGNVERPLISIETIRDKILPMLSILKGEVAYVLSKALEALATRINKEKHLGDEGKNIASQIKDAVFNYKFILITDNPKCIDSMPNLELEHILFLYLTNGERFF
jgi:hypothetical protein